MTFQDNQMRRVGLIVALVVFAGLTLSVIAVATAVGADGDQQTVELTTADGQFDGLHAVEGAVNDTERTDDAPTTDTATGSTLYVNEGSHFGGVEAINVTSGDTVWSNNDVVGSGDGMSAPTVAYGTVYITGTYSPDDIAESRLWALDAETGTVEWNFTVDRTDDSFTRNTAPTVVNDTVYVGLGESDNKGLYAIDAHSGEKEWVRDDLDALDTPTVVDGTVYMTDWGDDLHAFDAETGDTEWVYSGEAVTSNPTVADGTLYVGANFGSESEGELHALDAETGDLEWTFSAIEETSIQSDPVVDNGTVYFGGSGGSAIENFRLYAVSTVTGEKQWSWVHEERRIGTAPTVDGERVYLKMDSGHYTNTYAIDADTGDLDWTESTGDGGSITTYDDRVYLRANTCAYCSTRVQVHDDETGDELWNTGSVNSPMTITDDPEEGFSVDSAATQGLYGHTETYGTDSEFGQFEVTDLDPQDPVIAGDDLDVDVAVENSGDETVTDDIELVVDGTVADTAEDVELAPGETWSGTLRHTTDADDAPEISLTVTTDHDSQSTTATVDPLPAFEVEITDVTDPVGVEDTLLVETAVENTASVTEDQVVTLSINGTLADSVVVELNPGASTDVTLNYTTDSNDLPALEATVGSDHDEDSTTVSVVDTTTPVGADVGDVNQDGEVTIVDAALIQQHLAGMEPAPFDADLADVQRTGEVTIVDAVLIQQYLAGIADPSDLAVIEIDAPDAVDYGETKEITAELENAGDLGTIQAVELRLAEAGGNLDERTTVAVDVMDAAPAADGTVTFTLDTSDLSPGTYEYGVFTDDDEETDTFTIEDD